MIRAQAFVEAARGAGLGLWSGVPCSYLKPFINYVLDDASLRYVGAANEGDAIAIASGAALAGVGGVAMMQNSGLGNAVSPLTSLNAIFKIPVLVIVTLRGEPGGPHDEPQHALMGRITTKMLETMEVPWEHFPSDEREIEGALARARGHMDRASTPYALVMKKGTVEDHALRSKPIVRALAEETTALPAWPAARPARGDVLRAVQRAIGRRDVVIATTGYTGRELWAIEDRPNQLYMVGSMGCASPFALGVALARRDRRARVVVLDGDGAALMRLGALATIGYERPGNLVHVLLDNEAHESTGAQSTVTHSVDLGQVARACGYPRVVRAGTADEVARAIAEHQGLTFVHAKIATGAPKDLPRPTDAPPDVAERLRAFLSEDR